MATQIEFFTSEATMTKHKKFVTIIEELFPPTYFTHKHSTKGLHLKYLLTSVSKHSPYRTILISTADLPNAFITVTCQLNDNHPALSEIVTAIQTTFSIRVTTTTDASGFEHFQFVVKSAVNASFTAFCTQTMQSLITVKQQFSQATRPQPVAAPTPEPAITTVAQPVAFELSPAEFAPLPSNPSPTIVSQWPVKPAVTFESLAVDVHNILNQFPEWPAWPTAPTAEPIAPTAEPTVAVPTVAKPTVAKPTVAEPDDDDEFTTTISADRIIYTDTNGQTRVKLPLKRINVYVGTKKMSLPIRDPAVTSIEHAIELFNVYATLRA
jgi:hypothetical protein